MEFAILVLSFGGTVAIAWGLSRVALGFMLHTMAKAGKAHRE